jgi:hypothetical protein
MMGGAGMMGDDELERLELHDGRHLAAHEPPGLAAAPTTAARHQHDEPSLALERARHRRRHTAAAVLVLVTILAITRRRPGQRPPRRTLIANAVG